MATSTSGATEAQKYASFLMQQSWTTHSDAPMKMPRWGCAAVAVDGQIIAIGGSNDNDGALASVESTTIQHSKDGASTLALSEWSAMPDSINPRWWFGATLVPPNFGPTTANSDHDTAAKSADTAAKSAAAKPKILVAGGYFTAQVELFDPSTNSSWCSLPSMSVNRAGCAVASSWSLHQSSKSRGGGGVYVVGGWEGGEALGSVECLSFSAQESNEPSWTLLPSNMKHPRNHCAAVVVPASPAADDAPHTTTPYQLVVMGGLLTDNRPTNSVEAYDFSSGKWEELPPMKEKRDGCAAVAVGQCCIYVVGGNNDKECCLATAEYFDFRTREWTLLPHAMSQPRRACAAVVVDGHMVVLGGSNALQCFVESLRVAVDNDTALLHSITPAQD